MRISQYAYLKFLDKYPKAKESFVQFLVNRRFIEPKTRKQERIKKYRDWTKEIKRSK